MGIGKGTFLIFFFMFEICVYFLSVAAQHGKGDLYRSVINHAGVSNRNVLFMFE